MRAPSPTWEALYLHDRRKHRHRCRCCSKIINDGERVLMSRAGRSGRTWALHIGCADKLNSTPEHGWTWRDSFECWGTDYLISIGYRLPAHPMSFSGSIKSDFVPA